MFSDFKNNLIINGSFLFDQRFAGTHTYTSSISEYVLDRWFYDLDETTTGSSSVTRQNFSLGQTDVLGNPKKYCRWSHITSSSNGTYIRKSQRIEYVSTLSDKKAGVTFWAKAGSPINLIIDFRQHFGTGGSPSGDVVTTSQTIAITTTWKRYQLSFNIPSITGKTLGTNSNDYLEFRIAPPVNTSFVLDIANVNINEGIPTAFKLSGETEEEELLLCQRYYCKTFELEQAAITASGNFNGAIQSQYNNTGVADDLTGSFHFPTTMRTLPTITTYNPSSANSIWRSHDDVIDGTIATNTQPYGEQIANFVVSNGGNAKSFRLHVTADAEL